VNSQRTNLESIKQRALEISRSSDFQGKSPRSVEVKRFVSILLKLIETTLASCSESAALS
jgi:hypothetical protein